MASPPADEENTERRLRDLEAVLDAITDYGIIRLDPSGSIASWSRAVEAMTGYSAQETLGRPVSILHSEDDRTSGLVERELRAAAETGRFEGEGRRVRKNGEQFWVDATLVPLRGEDGALSGYAEVMRDVTERRRAESMFRDLLESAPDAIVIAGADGLIQLVNRQTEQLFGYTRDELIGQAIEILVPDRFRGRHVGHRDGYFAAARTRPMGMGLELHGARRDGTRFPVEISLSPLETDEGMLVSAAIRDVTERHEIMVRLEHQRDEILELSTPVIQVWDRVLALPIIGTLDTVRASRLTEGLLNKISQTQAEVVILDISGVPTIDTLVAQHLLKTVQAAALMGTDSIMSGVRPETAQSMVHLGIDMGRLRSRNTLSDALQLALRILAERVGEADKIEDGAYER